MKRVLTLLFLLLSVAAAAEAVLKSDAPKAELAKEFKLVYGMDAPENFNRFDLNRDSINVKAFEVSEQGCMSVGAALECTLFVKPFALAKTVFTGPEWVFYDADGTEIKREKAPDLELDIAKAYNFSIDKDIKEIRGHYFPIDIWFWLLVLSAVFLLFMFFTHGKKIFTSKRDFSGFNRTPKLPIEQESREKIEALIHSGIWEEGKFKEFYFSLTDIFRVYLHGRFGLSAEFQTSSEMLREIKKSKAKTILPEVKELIMSADLVKFARVLPSAEQRDADIKNVLTMIDETTPKPTPEVKA